MCDHVYTANYKQLPASIGKRCPYPEFYASARSTAPELPVAALPVDASGACLFHSQDVAWKREHDFEGRFLQLVQLLTADPDARHFDFAEFVFVGGASGPHVLRVADTVFLKQAYFAAAHFVDPLTLDGVDFKAGADFRRATFAGDLHVANSHFGGLALTGAEFRGLVWFAKVEIVSYALFDGARFTGTAGGHVVTFEDTRFDAITDFSGAAFALGEESSVGFLRTRFDDSTDFKRARFSCQLIFDDVSFAGLTEFIDTSFEIIGSSARYRGSALEFNRIVVTAGAVLRFQSTDAQRKLFDHDVQMSFRDDPAGLIQFENVNFKNLGALSREHLTRLARLGRVEIGSGCIKYRFQTPITKVDIGEGNAPLILKLCETFTNYFTVSNGFNLGFEVVERTGTKVHYFFFTDEGISEEIFRERLAATAQHMWSLLSVRSHDHLLALEAPAALARSAGKESAVINAVDCVTAMMGIFFGAGIRVALGKWKEADTRALRRAALFTDEDPEVARSLHAVLVDRYTGATLFDINGQQHAGLPPVILAYRDEPPTEVVDIAILTVIEVERRAVCSAFGLFDEHRVRRDSRVYWRGRLPLGNGCAYEMVVAQAADAANIDAAILTNDLLHHWRPSAAILVGIAASTDPTKVALGDVVLARDVYYYERGKVTPEGPRPEPQIISADATLWNNVTAVPDWEGEVPVDRPDGGGARPRVHTGVIASGEKVIADAAVRDGIAAGHRKIIAIEMEGYGFSRAVWQSFEHVRHLVIRAISDDGSPSKDDRWHAYAASAAAAFAKHFLLDRPLVPRVRAAPTDRAGS